MAAKDYKCPFLKKNCIEDKCAMWMEAHTTNVQTGEVTKADGCSIAKLPLLIMETNQRSFGVQKTIDSLKNNLAENQDKMIGLAARKMKLVGD